MIKNIVLYILLLPVYLFTCFFKIDKYKITFISYKEDELKGNFLKISETLKNYKEYNLNYILMKYENTLICNIKYFFNCIKQVYYINTSHVVILDYNNYVVSHFKRNGVKVLQIWHASGAIKKFGNDIKRDYKIKNYDYVIASSEKWKNCYSTAFNIDKSNILITGIPKTDNLFSKEIVCSNRESMMQKYPFIKNKKVILFAPTFRGDPIKDIKYQPINLEYIKNKLGKEYVIIYKMHPWFGNKIISRDKEIINGNNESIRALFSVTDYLITDYSAVLFDFTIMKKPIILYSPDLEEYKSTRGMYVDYENTMPAPICKTEDDVISAINNNVFDIERIMNFRDMYFKYQDANSTERVCKVIRGIIDYE
ncbi:CDP-glycerol glycerophosphotransferase family protein [Clostridium bornimense]|uniref:CDP-glycerol glycerophosphotransferase family protein n=1 Tax=Clostridium bornimense TaxID=1216932 RepID=UPI001C107981|nr:CDP-glycerol glycerophosphotransferase family protein [Clostridium bornimense]MBU5315162.1 CDP-glycerol glycerophosphotransferase family protein [Clostridium bornimense]